jgi:hypothetical protein
MSTHHDQTAEQLSILGLSVLELIVIKTNQAGFASVIPEAKQENHV